jgi:nitroreductase
MNAQPWDFVVITDKAMIQRIKGNVEWMENAGAVIAVVMDPASRWWIEDGAAAAENMLLAATALGYGGCWLEGNALRREDDLKLALGVPPEKRLMMLIPLGVPGAWPAKEKKSLADVIHWERY